MDYSPKTFNNAINKKFIKPLKEGCKLNINKLSLSKKINHNETVGLLHQAHVTLNTADKILQSDDLVDGCVLMRSAFEYIMMGVMIQFDESIYEEFTCIGIERDKTKIYSMINKFKTRMNELSDNVLELINRKEKGKSLKEIYDKLCNFTHSTVVVSSMIEIKNNDEIKLLKSLLYQPYWFIKMLLFFSLKYFTDDTTHYVDPNSIAFTYLFLSLDACDFAKQKNIDLTKYSDLLYYDKNSEHINKDLDKLKNSIDKFTSDVQDNSDEYLNELNKFLS